VQIRRFIVQEQDANVWRGRGHTYALIGRLNDH
jgi:hypothetical protein